MTIAMTGPPEKPLVDGAAIERIRRLAELVPQLQDAIEAAERAFAAARAVVRETSECLQYLAGTGLMPVLPTDLYLVNEDGRRTVVTAEQAERIRQEWSGHFLLDLSRQTLLVRTGKAAKAMQLGSARLHWGVQKILIVGMSQPGVGFGYAKFSKVSPAGSGIGDVSALTRYVHDARHAIGDTGRRSRYIHKTRVEPSESPTRWGYMFDDRYRYMVIAKCPPGNYADTTKSTGQSRVDQESSQ